MEQRSHTQHATSHVLEIAEHAADLTDLERVALARELIAPLADRLLDADTAEELDFLEGDIAAARAG